MDRLWSGIDIYIAIFGFAKEYNSLALHGSDLPAVGGRCFIRPEALQARIRIIHGGIGSDGYTGQRTQAGTPDKRTTEGKAWSESEPEPEPEVDTAGVYSTTLQHAGALHGMIQALHEEVKAFREVCVSQENPHGHNPDEEFRPELLMPPTKAPKPERKAAHLPTETEED